MGFKCTPDVISTQLFLIAFFGSYGGQAYSFAVNCRMQKLNINTEHCFIRYRSRPSLQTHVTRHAMRHFEDNSRVGLVRHKVYTDREQLLMS